jgi:hypothetical protein
MSFLIFQSTTIIESSSSHPGDNAECDFELCGPQRPVLSVLTDCSCNEARLCLSPSMDHFADNCKPLYNNPITIIYTLF